MRNEIDEGSDEKMHWLNIFDIAVSFLMVLFHKRITAFCVSSNKDVLNIALKKLLGIL